MKNLKFDIAISKYMFVLGIVVATSTILLVTAGIVEKETSLALYVPTIGMTVLIWLIYFLLKRQIKFKQNNMCDKK